MDSVDLNIDNYNLTDLLNLFKLNQDFTENELKSCKKMVLKLHPDKSSLDKKYFIFFSNAYKILYNIWTFKTQSSSDVVDYKDILNQDDDDAKLKLINTFTNDKNFLKNFNEAFSKVKLDSDWSKTGYGDWLRTDDFITIENSGNPSHAIEEYKKTQIIKKNNINSLIECDNNDIDETAPENYSSNLFSKLQFDDLKQAHSNSLIPVNQSMLNKSYNSLEQLVDARSNHIVVPDKKTSLEQIKQMESEDSKISTFRAYNLAKQAMHSKKANDEFNLIFNKLNYK